MADLLRLQAGDRVFVSARTLARIVEASRACSESLPTGRGAVVLKTVALLDERVIVRFEGKTEPWPVPLARIEREAGRG